LAADWVEIVVPVGARDVDEVAALVVDEIVQAAAGAELRGDEVVFWVHADDAAAASERTRDAVARWAAGGLAVDPARVRVAAAMPEAEWRDAWKRYFKVTRLTRQIVVVPSWETFAPGADDLAIALDPGMAFGTGAHQSTRLVLAELQALADAGVAPASVLDVGCGSGILAIAAAKLWPRARVVAIDNDPLAVQATIENAGANGADIDASARALADVEPAELVLANIQAHVLRELAEPLVARAPGTLVLSGLLAAQAPPLAEEFAARGFAIAKLPEDGDWTAVVLQRR
jgi:ribosomal protein L11 methyltransferase